MDKKREDRKWIWEQNESLYYGTNNSITSELILGIDMDGTLIKPLNNKKYPKSFNDWEFCFEESIVKSVLQMYLEKGYKIVIFTNQKGISLGVINIISIQKKIEAFTQKLGFPISALIATKSDHFRKPDVGMWEFLISNLNSNIQPNIHECLYIGDAAGRLQDHSNFDILFAKNINVRFYVPEKFFKISNFDFNKFRSNLQNEEEKSYENLDLNAHLAKEKHLIIISTNDINKSIQLYKTKLHCSMVLLQTSQLLNDLPKTAKKMIRCLEGFCLIHSDIDSGLLKELINYSIENGYRISEISLQNESKLTKNVNQHIILNSDFSLFEIKKK